MGFMISTATFISFYNATSSYDSDYNRDSGPGPEIGIDGVVYYGQVFPHQSDSSSKDCGPVSPVQLPESRRRTSRLQTPDPVLVIIHVTNAFRTLIQ